MCLSSDQHKTLVSFLITLREAIKRAQGLHVDKEITLVDDGSADGTTELLRNCESASLFLVSRISPRRPIAFPPTCIKRA